MIEPASRRSALGWIAGWLGGLGLGPLAACAGGLRFPRGTLVVEPKAVPVGTVTRVRFGQTPILLVNLTGSIRAFSGFCTHESCELGWNPRQQLIRCPCHGSAFFPDGTVKNGPAERPLPEYPAEIRRGRVVVSGLAGETP